MRQPKRVYELAASGIDEFLQGISSNPFSAPANPSYSGLRVPSFVAATGTQTQTPRFLFCLATFRTRGAVIRGIRQGLKIGVDTSFGTPPFRLWEQWVLTPDFRFVDGNVSWHLVKEPPLMPQPKPLTDTQNWIKRQSDGPAMLYESFTNSIVTPTGAPVVYCQGLTAYSPPNVATSWESVGGLGLMYDIRFPQNSPNAWDMLDLYVEGRVSLYASILQTNPQTRTNATYQTAVTTGTNNILNTVENPEETAISQFVNPGEAAFGVQYTRVFGSLIVEEYDGEIECCCPRKAA